jgi:transposase-like protein
MTAKSVLSADHFHDEAAALAFIEARVWPQGPKCPRCGEMARVGRLQGKSTKPGMCKCYVCRKPFTVTVGTVMESSHIPLHLWLQAMHLMCSSKKGISTHQLQRTLGVTLKSAWFLSHRLREAMTTVGMGPLGGAGAVIEADETYFGKVGEKPTQRTRGGAYIKRGKSGPSGKRAVVSLVERGGQARTFHVGNATKEAVQKLIRENVSPESRLHTDESRIYGGIIAHVANHETIMHIAREYARGDVTTNSVEGFFSVFKRGMRGIYQHCGEKHLHRYLTEFDFRFNHRMRLGVDDVARTDAALKSIVGKRLTYRTTRGQRASLA